MNKPIENAQVRQGLNPGGDLNIVARDGADAAHLSSIRFPHRRAATSSTDCPAAALGRQMAAVQARHETLDGDIQAQDAVIEVEQLGAHLLERAQWTTPTSTEGLMVTALAMHSALFDIAEYDREKGLVTAGRIVQRLVEGLSAVGGKTPAEMGLSFYWSWASAKSPDLADFEALESAAEPSS